MLCIFLIIFCLYSGQAKAHFDLSNVAQLSSQNDVDIDTEFANQRITGMTSFINKYTNYIILRDMN